MGAAPTAIDTCLRRLTRLNLDGTVRRDISLEQEPGALLWDGQAIWVANEKDNTLTKLAMDGKVEGVFPVGRSPSALLLASESIWVANQGDNSVSKIVLP